jgi:hypothetical protein
MNLMTYSEILKVHSKIQDAVNENFGYSPNEPWFDKLVQERNELMQVLRQEDHSSYEKLLNSW